MRKLIVSGILTLLVLSGCSLRASITTDEEITGIVSDYLGALESKDISAMVEYTNDLRFPDKNEQTKQYSNIEEEVTDTRMIEIKKVSETEFEATVEMVSDGELINLHSQSKSKKEIGKLSSGKIFSWKNYLCGSIKRNFVLAKIE